mgnify:CR=1 FL=1
MGWPDGYAHLGKEVLHPGPGLGNALVAPLPALAQRSARLGLSLDVLAMPHGLEHLTALCAWVAPVGTCALRRQRGRT